jgi:hypothetical protein
VVSCFVQLVLCSSQFGHLCVAGGGGGEAAGMPSQGPARSRQEHSTW